MGFECVVRGLRIERLMKRTSWPDNIYITFKDKEVRQYAIQEDGHDMHQQYMASGEDILATDWEISPRDPSYRG